MPYSDQWDSLVGGMLILFFRKEAKNEVFFHVKYFCQYARPMDWPRHILRSYQFWWVAFVGCEYLTTKYTR